MARRRWARGSSQVQAADAAVGAESPEALRAATARRRPYAARPGIRLDPDMGKAIQKLGRLQMHHQVAAGPGLRRLRRPHLRRARGRHRHGTGDHRSVPVCSA